MEEVDAVDNGISQYDGEARYTVSTTLSARVAHLNPRWNSKSQDTEVSLRTVLIFTAYKPDNTIGRRLNVLFLFYFLISRTKIASKEIKADFTNS